ncbi:MAG: enoyl-CoA hydratase [Deltaproteobacteria bacterium HGW-Deltaproteobacteria-12]|jgi:enoyl-CoA hydratase|nr:MAG: enoyl-CoA hydratase [Deltaproteobacteria bacterium HGW-Deltaproteobacteria-12]
MNNIKDWILLQKIAAVAVITLNNPRKMNVLTWELLEDMEKIQTAIENDVTIKAVVIKGEGKHFSTGVNLDTLKATDAQFMLQKLDWIQRVWSRWQELPVPVIAAIHGACIGGALELALALDIRIAADNAFFRLPEVGFGVSPDMGGTTRLTKLVGPGQAKRIILGNEEITAEEALRIGLVEIVVPAGNLEERALNLAKKMSEMPPLGMRWAKKGINLAAESSVRSGLLFEQAQSICCFMTEDLQEGLRAFTEKRKPVFKGK